MSEKEISLLVESTREFVRRMRAKSAESSDERPYKSDGFHLTVGSERPLSAEFESTGETVDLTPPDAPTAPEL
jgi:hypothetical protein